MRRESELNKLEHPEWLFKYLKDQIENASLRLPDPGSFVQIFLEAVTSVIFERYQADIEDASDGIPLLDELFDFKYGSLIFDLILDMAKDPSPILSSLSSEFERHFNQTLDTFYTSTLSEALRPHSLSLKSLVEDYQHLLIDRYSQSRHRDTLILASVTKPGILAMQKAIKTKINSYEL